MTTRAIPTVTLRQEEAAEALGVSVRWFQINVQPNIPTVRVGRMVLYRVQDLEKWAEANLERR